ncbi:MAG TPA: hypothetical protein VGM38_09270 [Pseudolysinimonas sp.]
MRIDESLNIVVPVDRTDGTTVYVHAAPISREVFQRYWLPLSKAFALIYGEGLHLAGPRIAAMSLQKVSEDLRVWDGPMGVQRGLMPEIRRLANVVAPGAGSNGHATGWQMIPYDDALKAELIDQEDGDEIDGVLVFFTLAWRLNLRKERKGLIDGLVALWGAQTSSSSLSEYAASLPISTETANTGATAPVASSPQSSTGPAMTDSTTALLSGPMTASSPGIPQ